MFFNNSGCEYFPCHEVEDKEDFNCLFCYCPLYTLGSKCGGQFIYLDNGNKRLQRVPYSSQKGIHMNI